MFSQRHLTDALRLLYIPPLHRRLVSWEPSTAENINGVAILLTFRYHISIAPMDDERLPLHLWLLQDVSGKSHKTFEGMVEDSTSKNCGKRLIPAVVVTCCLLHKFCLYQFSWSRNRLWLIRTTTSVAFPRTCDRAWEEAVRMLGYSVGTKCME